MGNGLRQDEDHDHESKTSIERISSYENSAQNKSHHPHASPWIALFISAPAPALARDQVPFNGTVSGYVETQEPVDQCTVHIHVVNFGNANQLGAFTGTAEFYPNFCEDPPNITYTGTFDWFAATGDEISGTFAGYLSPTGTPGLSDNHETAGGKGGRG